MLLMSRTQNTRIYTALENVKHTHEHSNKRGVGQSWDSNEQVQAFTAEPTVPNDATKKIHHIPLKSTIFSLQLVKK